MLTIKPQPRPAPTLGVLVNAIDVFSAEAKDRTEAAIRAHFKRLLKSGEIDPRSLIEGRIFGPHEAMGAADRFAAAKVDLILIVNVAFPNGQVFLTLATHPHLAKVPLAVAADPEPSTTEWANNAWCGVIMNNYVAKRLSRPIATLPGPVEGAPFKAELDRLIRVAATIKWLRRDFLGRFGDSPGGFHSATGDQIAFANTFGTRVDTVDLTAVMETYKTGHATGYLGESAFTDEEVRALAEEIPIGRKVEVPLEAIERASRLYHAYRAIVRANGYTSAAFRCWPEMLNDPIGTSACLAMTLLLTNADLTAIACESDWPIAVAQTMGSVLSGTAAHCLDFVNYTGGSDVVQLGHCGIGVCGAMAGECACGPCDTIAFHPVVEQVGKQVGPSLVGQFAYGPKTGIGLMQRPDGRFVLLAFEGESSPDTAKGMRYSAADLRVPQYKELNRIVLEQGFPHHVALAHGHHSADLQLLCAFLGVEFVSP